MAHKANGEVHGTNKEQKAARGDRLKSGDITGLIITSHSSTENGPKHREKTRRPEKGGKGLNIENEMQKSRVRHGGRKKASRAEYRRSPTTGSRPKQRDTN